MPARPRTGSKRPSWEHLADDDLLRVRICDLDVRIEGSELEPRVRQLRSELDERGIGVHPHCYLSDEWLSPKDQMAIGIPFYLAHPRLKALEFRMMFDVEGGTPTQCMRLLRHEAGHSLDHAFRLHRREDWQRIFGSPRAPYNPYFYLVDPHSKKHVRNLPEDYAQCHPEEDFAETFAVWLNPGSQWKSRYKGWPAMRKLRYVDRLMRTLRGRPSPRRKPSIHTEARSLRSTLRSYYQRKFRVFQLGDLSFALRDMKKIFRASRSQNPEPTAAGFIRRHKRELVESIAAWSGERKHRTASMISSLARLCDQHSLVMRDAPETSLVRLSTYVTTLIVNRLHTYSYRLRKHEKKAP